MPNIEPIAVRSAEARNMQQSRTEIEYPRLALTVTEAASLAGVSRPTMYQWMKTNGFPAFKIGNCTRIPVQGFTEWLEQQTKENPAAGWCNCR